MADLHGELGIGIGMNPVRNALPGLLLLRRVSPGAARRDAPLGADTGHLGKHQPRPAHGARAQMHEVIVSGHAVHGRVLGHGRHHDAVLEREPAQPVGQEHGRRRLAIRGHAISFGQPALIAVQPGGIAQAQILVTDALAARQHGVHELLGLELIAVALSADLEPLHRIPGRVLQAQRLHTTRLLVGGQHLGNMHHRIADLLELARQLDGILNRQLGPRADCKMRRMHGIAHQHHMAAPGIAQPPLVADHALKIDPGRTAQMSRIGHQLLALQIVRKQLFAEGNGLLLVGAIEAAGLPAFLRGLDDESRSLVVELVDMRLEPAMLGAHEIKGEGLVDLVRAQPDVAIGTGDDIGLESVLVLAADAGVHAVAGNDEVGIRILLVALHIGLEHQVDTQLLAARLQDVEQVLAANPHKAMAAGANPASLEQQFDIVPMVEGLLDLRRRHRVPDAHIVHGGIGEHHAPAEGVIGQVALHHRHLVRRVHLLHQQREIQAGGAATYADDLHDSNPFLARREMAH